MVIQRLQSLYLLIAAVIIAALCFVVPVATMQHDGLTTTYYVKDFMPSLIINMIIAALLLVTIFLYKNLKLQMRVTLLVILLTVVAIGIFGYIVSAKLPVGATTAWIGSAVMFMATIIFTVLAYNGMKKDHKLLRSYDRLR